jgi:hypothetical protein
MADSAMRLKQLPAGFKIGFRLGRAGETESQQDSQCAHRLADCTTQNGCRTGKVLRTATVDPI